MRECKAGCVCYLPPGMNHPYFIFYMYSSSSLTVLPIHMKANHFMLCGIWKCEISSKKKKFHFTVSVFNIWRHWSWKHFLFFSVIASPQHCLQITFSSAPLGVSGFFGLVPALVYTPLSTGYKAAQHANMLWHFAYRTDLGGLLSTAGRSY